MTAIVSGSGELDRPDSGEYLQEVARVYSFDAPEALRVRNLLLGPAPVDAYEQNPLLLSYSQIPGNPVPDVNSFTRAGDGTVWLGTPRGVTRLRNGCWRYYAGRRWLPDDSVTALVLDNDGSLLVGTASGVASIKSTPMTLEQKAEHYESLTAERHNRDGFVASCRLTAPGDVATYLYEATDNDGLWTSLYVCAQCFRWAVTGDRRALVLARASMRALLSLLHVTGIDGFPARALIHSGERVWQSDPGPNWFPAPRDPGTLYKNDTSSDEIDGHYLAWYWFFELAADEAEKRAISAACRAVTEHILDHNYTLVGPTGKPTSWGVWSPAKLNGDPEWLAERGLNSLEMLSHLKVAAHICAEPRFEAAYRHLIEAHGYGQNTVGQKIVPPVGENNHSDDELAACAYYPLFRLEDDPVLSAAYRESLERTHAALRPEGSPFYNALYSASSGGSFDRAQAVEWFRDAPWDLRDWRMDNSQRADVEFAPALDRFARRQLTRVLPPGERRVTKWNSNPYAADAGGEGETEEDGTFWLLPYWMCRYHRFI